MALAFHIMNSILLIVVISIFIGFSWIVKGILFWIACRKKSHQLSIKHTDNQPSTSKESTNNKSISDKVSTGKHLQPTCLQNKTTGTKFFKNEKIVPLVEDVEEESVLEDLDEKNAKLNDRRKKLLSAVENENAEEISCAIEWAMLDGCKNYLNEELFKAQQKLKLLENLDRIRTSFYTMRATWISELRSYANPPKVVCDVMISVFLLLGTPKAQLTTWTSVQALLCNNGRNKLKRMIDRHQLNDVSPNIIDEVNNILAKYDFQSVYIASEGAAAFYIWVQETIQKKRDNIAKSV